MTTQLVAALEALGSPISEQLATLRYSFVLFFELIAESFRQLLRPSRAPEVIQQIVSIGIGSLPIITVSTAFAGFVVTNEIAWHMDRALHSVTMIPGLTGQFVLRELGIAVPALLLVAKVGASITAEVGSMKVTEQIDALKLLGIEPVGYLVYPRFVATVVASACLTLIASAMTLAAAISVACTRFGFSLLEYLNALRHFVTYRDLVCALTKGIVFGAVIPIISCAYGFRCKGGAEGVGTATTNSVVTSTVAIILLDFILTFLFTRVL